MSRKWTDEQQVAIERTDADLIVTAGAGSGKTSTMIERALAIVSGGTSVDNIVMLTFTEAAAKEMKEKMRARLIAAAKETTEPARRAYLVEQLDALPYARISTIHAYCAALIREYFEQIPLAPNLRVLDEDTCRDLMQKAFEQLLKEREGDAHFDELRFKVGLRDDKDLFELIIKLYEFMTNQPNREQWLTKMYENTYPIDLAAGGRKESFEQSAIAKWFVGYVSEGAKRVADDCRAMLAVIDEQNKAHNAFALIHQRAHEFEDVRTVQDIYRAYGNAQAVNGKIYAKGLDAEQEIYRVKDNYEKLVAEPVKGMVELGTYDELVDMHLNSADFVHDLCTLTLRFQDIFARQKADMGGLDYADLERYALRILQDESIAAEVRSHNHYVFVDEFQDTNDVQYAIIGSITPPERMFMVGDSKQCIYRFRAAEPRIFLRKLSELQGQDKSVSFSKNFRSDNGILTFVNKVFDVLMTPQFGGVDYRGTDRFVLREGNVDSGTQAVSMYLYPAGDNEESDDIDIDAAVATGTYSVRGAPVAAVDDTKSEGLAIVQYVKSLYGQTVQIGGESRKLTYRDFAILVAKRTSIVRLLPTLMRCGLPLNLDNLAGDVGLRDARVMLAYANVLDNRMQDYPLLTVMRSPLGGFDDADLAEIRLISTDARQPFWQVLDAYMQTDTALARRVRAFSAMVEEHRFAAAFTPIGTLLGDVMLATGYTDYLLAQPDGLQRIAAVNRFLTGLSAKTFACDLASLCAFYRNFPLTELDNVSTSVSDRIVVGTMHGSKGLEYPVVILPGLGDKVDADRSRVKLDKYLGIGTEYYDSATRERRKTFAQYVIDKQLGLFAREDRLRLLYVAMTRAQSRLFLCGGYPDKVAFTPREESKFSKWLRFVQLQDISLSAHLWTPAAQTEESTTSVVATVPLDDGLQDVLDGDYAYSDAVAVRKKYTVTALNARHNDEDAQLPSFLPGPEETRTGSLYHVVFQHIDYAAVNADAVSDEMLRLVEEGILTPEEAADVDCAKVAACLRLPLLARTLQPDVRTYHEQRFVMESSARSLQMTADESVLIQGVIDLLLVSNEDVIVVDFKMSNRSAAQLKESYAVQLAMYCEAVSRALNRPVTQCYLVEINRAAIIPMMEENK